MPSFSASADGEKNEAENGNKIVSWKNESTIHSGNKIRTRSVTMKERCARHVSVIH